MGRSSPALELVLGAGEHPLSSGWCRRAGCAEPAVGLGFCDACLERYHRERDASEAALAREAAATRRKLTRGDEARDEAGWTLALSEHLAAAGIDPDAPREAEAVYEALVSALLDYSRPPDAELAGLAVAR